MRPVFSPIIERNTTVPCSRVERFFSVHDDQVAIRVAVYQGESIHVQDNVYLDALEIDIPKAKAGEQAVDVRFSYDVNGLLEVDVTTLSTNEARQLLIKGNASNLSKTEIEACRDRLAALKVHPRENEANLALIYRGKHLFENLLGPQRMLVGAQLEEFLATLETQDPRKIVPAQEAFDAFLTELERDP